MKIISAFIVSMLISVAALAQLENNHWYFGHRAGLDFSSGAPVALLDGQMDQWEGVASISSPAGDLLFYTDGDTVWNKLHVPMSNGTHLGGAYSSTQSATIIHNPGSHSEYYIFTPPETSPTPSPATYSIVDMSLDSGNGDVSSLNNILFNDASEKCAVVYDSSGIGVWVIFHDNFDSFYSYQITSSGITGPVISPHTFIIGTPIGYLKANACGNRLAMAQYDWNIAGVKFSLFDFDIGTGLVTNQMNINASGSAKGTYGIEFSNDGMLLYTAGWEVSNPITTIYQFDISLGSVSAILASKDSIGSINQQIGALQTGPDGKIYISPDYDTALSVINFPNVAGVGCSFTFGSISLAGRRSGIGLPALISPPCITSGLPENASNNNLELFPNPVQDIVTIKNLLKGKVEFFNALGDVVLVAEIASDKKQEAQFDLSHLPSGIYMIRNDRFSHKFIKQ